MHPAVRGNIFYCGYSEKEVTVSNVLSEKIKALRQARGWSQLQLAARIGVEQSTVSRWERGHSAPVGIYLTFLERLLAGKRVRK